MAQTQEVRGVATKVRHDGGYIIVRYHNTDVIKFTSGVIRLDNGGWITATTALRINQACHQYGLNVGVSRKQGKMFFYDESGVKHPFRSNTLVYDRRTKTVDEDEVQS